MIILKLNLNKYGVNMRIGTNWLRKGSSDGLLWDSTNI